MSALLDGGSELSGASAAAAQSRRDSAEHRGLIVVTSHRGQPSCDELARLAAAGLRPRKDYVELARLLGADVLDWEYTTERAAAFSRRCSMSLGFPIGQVVESLRVRSHYAYTVAWADRLGLPIAAGYKALRCQRPLVMISGWLSPRKKSLFLRPLGVHSHLRAIVSYSSKQMQFAEERLGVPKPKLFLGLQPVDDHFWRPGPASSERIVCSVGSERRDYRTLVRAVRGLDVSMELAVGNVATGDTGLSTGEVGPRLRELDGEVLPPNTRVGHYDPLQLRDLYGRSRFVVVPLQDVDYDAGVTVIAEAMAMGKAVIATRSAGQVDLIKHSITGILVPPGNPTALREAITQLLRNPEDAERMGRAGRQLVETRHTLDAYVQEIARIVRDAAGLSVPDSALLNSVSASSRHERAWG